MKNKKYETGSKIWKTKNTKQVPKSEKQKIPNRFQTLIENIVEKDKIDTPDTGDANNMTYFIRVPKMLWRLFNMGQGYFIWQVLLGSIFSPINSHSLTSIIYLNVLIYALVYVPSSFLVFVYNYIWLSFCPIKRISHIRRITLHFVRRNIDLRF